MGSKIDLKSNSNKFAVHGFFFSIAYNVAEPSTILPLVINYFSQNNILIGLFSSLVRGGTVLMQLYMAFFVQSFKRVLPFLRFLFLMRLVSWLMVGLSLYYFSEKRPILTLWLVGAGLFSFSFFAGFGTILFHELLGKMFSHKYRGVTWANRQILMSLGGILSAVLSAWLFRKYEQPLSFALAFLVSFVFMAVGYIIVSMVKEDVKDNINIREPSFWLFIKNVFSTLKTDRVLVRQIVVCILSNSYVFSMPFIVKNYNLDLNLPGLALGSVIPLLAGGVLGNIVWKNLSFKGNDKMIIQLSFLMIISALILAIVTKNIYQFMIIYLLAGAASDGFRLSFKNLVLSIAPEHKRPVYFAVQNNLTSIGLFFSIPGGWILQITNFNFLILFSVVLLLIGYILSFKLKNI